MLWHFAKDDTVAEAAQRTGLSVNAVSTIFVKLRRFFTEAGLFTDIYQGSDPANGSALAEIEYERHLIEFHFARVRAKRGIGSGPAEIDHFAESHWRFHYAMLVGDRGGDAVHHMMHRHLLEMVRLCGPVGRPPINRREGLRLCLSQMDKRILWAERNSRQFRDDRAREEIRSILQS
ncbi:MAG: hypothetical protein DI527_20880 [Chelatococcus sp.]|nr:MAG: hypothetical protein DI527_20880 [Chelatococcus sp.]